MSEQKRPTLSLKRKATPTAASTEKRPEKPVQAAKKSAKRAKHGHKQMLRLISLFPDLMNETEPKPFKVGILADMIASLKERESTFGVGQVKSALARYTTNYRYQKALAAGGHR